MIEMLIIIPDGVPEIDGPFGLTPENNDNM